MKKFFSALLIIFVISGCSTLEIKSDYDKDFSFDGMSKFSVLYNKKDDRKDFTRSRIAKVLSKHFNDKGYKLTKKDNAEFYVLFHLDIEKKSQVETNYERIGVHPRGYYRLLSQVDPTAAQIMHRQNSMIDTRVTTNTYEYEEGRLIIELLDNASNTIVWQGVVEDEISDISSQEQIQEIVETVFKDFPRR